jgi:DNA repair protein RecO (recombination protein O)
VALYRDRGVVLRTYRLGEADRIVVLLTEGHGKVRAVAKGVRKTKSRFGSRLEPTSHVALLLYEGRELDVVTQADSIDHHPAVRADLGRLAKATALLEAVDHVAQDREPDAQLYRMLVGALHALDRRDSPLLVPAFFWKLLAAEGVAPLVDGCARCGDPDDLVAFDLAEGGVLCRAHRSGVPISADALALLRRILTGELNAALAEPAGPATRELDALATATMEVHVERRLRAPAVHLDADR